jgi:hypothetical protein
VGLHRGTHRYIVPNSGTYRFFTGSHGLDGMTHSGHFLFILCYFTGFYTVSDLAVIYKNTR